MCRYRCRCSYTCSGSTDTNADVDVDEEVNPYADIDTALVIDTHVWRCRQYTINNYTTQIVYLI